MSGVVLLIRHAEAGQAAGLADRDRALTVEGASAFARLARDLAGEVRVERILTSPYLRARATADLLAAATGAAVEEVEELASGHGGARDLLRLAAAAGPGCAIVGHNPEVAEALALVAGRPEPVPPGTTAALRLAPDRTLALGWTRRP